MKQQLRKSTSAQSVRTYFELRANCACRTHCGIETSWYPEEAHVYPLVTVTNIEQK